MKLIIILVLIAIIFPFISKAEELNLESNDPYKDADYKPGNAKRRQPVNNGYPLESNKHRGKGKANPPNPKKF
uniref:Uncharacterized protein n=1 Tax=Meloidogyne enterolobii TaxID=390850 RepID=A0A6V7TS06_MELEN|nr:unnamed protein product [Meloidogyne enterolobii]